MKTKIMRWGRTLLDVGAAGGAVLVNSAGGIARVVPGMAAALGRQSPGKDEVCDTLHTRINDLDMAHMQAFPAELKAHVMDRMMRLKPLANEVCGDSHHYEKALMRLHEDGYGLIDLQPMETVLTAVWYRKSRVPWSPRADVAMVVWETEPAGETTTVMTWRI